MNRDDFYRGMCSDGGVANRIKEKLEETSSQSPAETPKAPESNLTETNNLVANQPESSTQLPSIYDNTGYIPEPPPIIDENLLLNALGEPTLQSLGLASYYVPTGWIQLLLENIHVGLGLPWYQTIIIYAILLRTALMPITIKSQRNAAVMRKLAPLTNKLRDKINEAKMTGDTMKITRATHEYAELMKSHNVGFGSFLLPIAQIPVFVSTFMAIRGMCNLPVESLRDGGALWFHDLTVIDPTYILPTLSVLSILAVVYRGIETGISLKNMTPVAKIFVFGLSAISFPFLIFMPSGIMVYFCTTNFISLLMSFVLNVDNVKRLFKIPVLTPNDLREIRENSKKEKNFISGFKESLANQKIINEVKEREQLRARQFVQAGTKVPQRTYKENPKKLNPPK